MENLPNTQYAIQLVGPDQIRLYREKPVPRPVGRQVLAQVEAVGLCFSDMKLLHQFDQHVRKGPVVSGVDPYVLENLPSYVPGYEPTVPGHEAVVRIVAVGPQAEWLRPGQRWIVQADFRNVRTAESNGAFGYNFEGALQQYTLLDESILGDPSDPESYLIAAPEGPSASSMALVEPWGCVENSYTTHERRQPLDGGNLLLVAATPEEKQKVLALYNQGPATVSMVFTADEIAELEDQAFTDAVLFAPSPEMVEAVSDKLANKGIACVVQKGKPLGRPCNIGVGRLHYGYCRWCGTQADDPADAYAMIPETGELRPNEKVLVVGAGGPMGQMHMLRCLMSGLADTVVGTDVDDSRLEALTAKCRAYPAYQAINVAKNDVGNGFTYAAIMAPVPELVVDALNRCGDGALINVFAGIPIGVKHPIDLDAVVRKRIFMFGTSGSDTKDMRAVLGKILEGKLDTDASVAAVCGMAGAEEGLRAVQSRKIEGKIVVYPSLQNLGLCPLGQLSDRLPEVASLLENDNWNLQAESKLLGA